MKGQPILGTHHAKTLDITQNASEFYLEALFKLSLKHNLSLPRVIGVSTH
jgi:hypothetical protein